MSRSLTLLCLLALFPATIHAQPQAIKLKKQKGDKETLLKTERVIGIRTDSASYYGSIKDFNKYAITVSALTYDPEENIEKHIDLRIPSQHIRALYYCRRKNDENCAYVQRPSMAIAFGYPIILGTAGAITALLAKEYTTAAALGGVCIGMVAVLKITGNRRHFNLVKKWEIVNP